MAVRSTKTHVKPDWGKVSFGQGGNNILVRHMSNQVVIKLCLAEEGERCLVLEPQETCQAGLG